RTASRSSRRVNLSLILAFCAARVKRAQSRLPQVAALTPEPFRGWVQRRGKRRLLRVDTHPVEGKRPVAFPWNAIAARLERFANHRDEVIRSISRREDGPPAEVQRRHVHFPGQGWVL